MLINTRNNSRRKEISRRRHSESGVTILEMVVSMLLLTVGLLGLAGAIGYAVTVSNKGRNITNSKLMVVSILEQVESLRNTSQLKYGQIANAGNVDNTNATRNFGGFPTTFVPVSINPGPDLIYGTGDDFTNQALAVPGYTRQILITDLSSNLKRVQVTLQYPDVNGRNQQLVGVSYLNNDDRTSFR